MEVTQADSINKAPMFFKLFQCIFPFFVIGAGTVITGQSFAGFTMFYIVNCIWYTAIVVKEIPSYSEIWKRVKKTSIRPSKNLTVVLTGALLWVLSIAIIAIYGYLTKPTSFEKQVRNEFLANFSSLFWI